MISTLLSLFLIVSTLSANQESNKAEMIIEKAIEAYGGDKFKQTNISFTFRGTDYSIYMNNGMYEYKRISRKGDEVIEDVLNNDGFVRNIDGEKSILSWLYESKYSSSVNSVVYFALLPSKLPSFRVGSDRKYQHP